MKNRRLNVLFIAIIALAATPQAIQDVRRLVSAAQERAEVELLSVFLSYQTTGETDREAGNAKGLVADNRRETKASCSLDHSGQAGETRDSESKQSVGAPARINRQARRVNAKADSADAKPVQYVEEETVASVDVIRTVAFSEKETRQLKAALHARDADKMADEASRAALASFVEGRENLQIKTRQLKDMDKLMRQRNRYIRGEADEQLPPPNPVGTM